MKRGIVKRFSTGTAIGMGTLAFYALFTVVVMVALPVVAVMLLARCAVEAAGERMANLRWRRHAHRCSWCHPVVMSAGPPWLLCQRGRDLGGAVTTGKPWPGLEHVLRSATGVPAERRN